MVNPNRIQWLNRGRPAVQPNGPQSRVLYWMFRDKRVEDNWALLHAAEIAKRHKMSLAVTYTIVPDFGEFTLRHHHFVLHGLSDVSEALAEKKIAFQAAVTKEGPVPFLADLVKASNVRAVVTDFLPLREKLAWDNELAAALGDIPLARVDA